MKNKKYHSTKYSLFPQGELDLEDDDSWQVSYLDIITIVLGFLIILLSVSQLTKTTSLSSIYGQSSDETEYFTTPIENIQNELVELLNTEIDDGELEIIRDLNDLRIRFNSDDLYQSGEAQIQEGSEGLLNRILIAFQQTTYNDFQIDVEGHTDNVPIATAGYPSNWELSTARASNIVRYFTEVGIPAERLKASGYADSRPIIEYDSLGFPYAASKEKNRRVVLRLYYDIEDLLEREQQEEILVEGDVDNPPVQEDIVISEVPAIVTVANQNNIEEQIAEFRESQNETRSEVAPPPAVNPEPTPRVQESISNQIPETNTESLPEPDRINEPEVEESVLPNLLKVDSRCVYSVKLANESALNRTFQRAQDLENRLNVELDIIYNSSEFSIRSATTTSFSDILIIQEQLSNRLNNSQVGVVHQCYNNTVERPKPIQYQIQFGAFQNQNNALDYTIDLMDDFGIQAYMNRVGDSYNILAGPYNTRDEVLSNLNSFRDAGVASNIFIKHEPKTVYDFSFVYQIQVASFPSEEAANKLAYDVSNNAGINTRVVELTDGNYSVMTGQSSSLTQTQAVFDRLRRFGNNVNPIIFYLEYIP